MRPGGAGGQGARAAGSGVGGVDGLDKVAHVEPLWAPVNHACPAAANAPLDRAKEAPKVPPRDGRRSCPPKNRTEAPPLLLSPFYCVACQLSVRPSFCPSPRPGRVGGCGRCEWSNTLFLP